MRSEAEVNAMLGRWYEERDKFPEDTEQAEFAIDLLRWTLAVDGTDDEIEMHFAD